MLPHAVLLVYKARKFNKPSQYLFVCVREEGAPFCLPAPSGYIPLVQFVMFKLKCFIKSWYKMIRLFTLLLIFIFWWNPPVVGWNIKHNHHNYVEGINLFNLTLQFISIDLNICIVNKKKMLSQMSNHFTLQFLTQNLLNITTAR